MSQKKHSIEYRLLITPTYNDTLKKEGILFLLETSKQFTNFSYNIDVKEDVDGNKIVWSLHGLRAPSMNMPSTGAAQYRKVYFDLSRTVQFTLIKKGKIAASTELKFLKSSIKTSHSAMNFLKIYTNEQEFEKNRLTDSDVPELKPDVHRAPAKQQSIKKKKTKGRF